MCVCVCACLPSRGNKRRTGLPNWHQTGCPLRPAPATREPLPSSVSIASTVLSLANHAPLLPPCRSRVEDLQRSGKFKHVCLLMTEKDYARQIDLFAAVFRWVSPWLKRGRCWGSVWDRGGGHKQVWLMLLSVTLLL